MNITVEDLRALMNHKAFPLLLAGASGVIIFGLYPGMNGLLAAYSNEVHVANVPGVMAAEKYTGEGFGTMGEDHVMKGGMIPEGTLPL